MKQNFMKDILQIVETEFVNSLRNTSSDYVLPF
jgi:hypothetical protein